MDDNPEKKKDFEITRETLENIINYFIEESDNHKEELFHQKYIIEKQKEMLEGMFCEYNDLANKYEDLFTTMMMEENTAYLRKQIVELKDSLKLAESLMDFKENKNKK